MCSSSSRRAARYTSFAGSPAARQAWRGARAAVYRTHPSGEPWRLLGDDWPTRMDVSNRRIQWPAARITPQHHDCPLAGPHFVRRLAIFKADNEVPVAGARDLLLLG